MKKLLIIFISILLTACATTQLSDRCKSYTISGDDVAWKPTKFYQSKSSQNILYIEIPDTVRYYPKLEVIDTEFDQPYKTDYSFDPLTHRFKVTDNYDKYLLYRDSSDGLEKEKVYITCNRNLIK